MENISTCPTVSNVFLAENIFSDIHDVLKHDVLNVVVAQRSDFLLRKGMETVEMKAEVLENRDLKTARAGQFWRARFSRAGVK